MYILYHILAHGQDIRALYCTYCHNEDFSHCCSFPYVATVIRSRRVGCGEENNLILEGKIFRSDACHETLLHVRMYNEIGFLK
jgi:hypothetical protein